MKCSDVFLLYFKNVVKNVDKNCTMRYYCSIENCNYNTIKGEYCMDNLSKKRERFVELAEKRTNVVLKNLDLLGNLSNKNNYEFSQEDFTKIIKTIREATNELERKYNNSITGKKTFKL